MLEHAARREDPLAAECVRHRQHLPAARQSRALPGGLSPPERPRLRAAGCRRWLGGRHAAPGAPDGAQASRTGPPRLAGGPRLSQVLDPERGLAPGQRRLPDLHGRRLRSPPQLRPEPPAPPRPRTHARGPGDQALRAALAADRSRQHRPRYAHPYRTPGLVGRAARQRAAHVLRRLPAGRDRLPRRPASQEEPQRPRRQLLALEVRPRARQRLERGLRELGARGRGAGLAPAARRRRAHARRVPRHLHPSLACERGEGGRERAHGVQRDQGACDCRGAPTVSCAARRRMSLCSPEARRVAIFPELQHARGDIVWP